MLLTTILILVVTLSSSAPVKAPIPSEDPQEHDPNEVNADSGLEYDRYLREIVSVLEEDEKFRQKLENTSIDDIKSGAIAHQLEYVDHNIRTKLDEIKRREVTRLRDLARQKRNLEMNDKAKLEQRTKDGEMRGSPFPSHIDHGNPHTFEIDDLKKLIKEATRDLEEQDKVRKEEFKRYEMEKEHKKREELAQLEEGERKKKEEEMKKMEAKHKDHPNIHHPGSKDQLEEVWEETDHLDKEDFDPRTFFKLHDTNQDDFLDEMEVEALFERELSKIYDGKNPEDDMVEKEEERSRMREHVFGEIDKDKDYLISLDEFLRGTQGDNYEKDEGWKTIDDEETQQFSEDDFKAYEKELEERERKMQAKHQKANENIRQPVKEDNVVKLEAGGGHGTPADGPIHVERSKPEQHEEEQQQQEQHRGPPQNAAKEAKVP